MRKDGQEEPQPKHGTKAKGDGKRRERENIVKKWQYVCFSLLTAGAFIMNLAPSEQTQPIISVSPDHSPDSKASLKIPIYLG